MPLPVDTLFPPPAPKLTDRQARVLTLARQAGPDGITADQAGHELHHDCAYCRSDGGCQYVKASGLEVLRALKRKGLVTAHRGGVYKATGARQTDDGYDPATAPFPDGY